MEDTAWKMAVFGVFLVRIFPHSDWIWSDTEYVFVFSPYVGKYKPEKLPIWPLFTQWKQIQENNNPFQPKVPFCIESTI